MKNLTRNIFYPLAVMVLISCNSEVTTNEPEKEPILASNVLYDQILELDQQLFDAFHSGDSITVSKMFSEDLEFFHDQAGLLSYEQNLNGLKNLMNGPTKVRRALITESLEVYPINNYGAIQIGKHQFYNQRQGEKEQLMGSYKFVHVWKNNNGNWQITRVISYDH